MSPALGDGTPNSEHHPDLNQEVAALSTKLIHAINNQTNLDDALSRTKAELEEARERIQQLESLNASQREMLAGDVWVRRKTVEAEKISITARMNEEKKARQETERDKKKIELELENLSQALFEEAQKMVIAAKEEARREQEAVLRRNDLLKAQLADTEGLLKSQQEQLSELKQVMEHMSVDRDDQTAITAPSSPGFSKFDPRDDTRAISDGGSQVGLEPVSPSHPTSFTHLLQPVLRTDLNAYEDFVGLVRTSKMLPRSRPASGTQSTFSALGMALAGAAPPANHSTSSLSTMGSPVSAATGSPSTPYTPATTISMASVSIPMPLPPLKETKFYKRVLAEDIEPTLRLDTAPGLSWLARRSVLNAMTDGNLVVEPVPTTGNASTLSKILQHPCSLCGDNRKEEAHLRRHRFRTNESEAAQRYPLCKYCLGRVRSTCDFLGFLRIVKDGHWRADDEDAERAAWEESVRLREQMFWSRIGGGVVPTTTHNQGTMSSVGSVKSPRIEQGDKMGEDTRTEVVELEIQPKDITPISQQVTPVAVTETTPEAAVEPPQTPPQQSNRSSTQSLTASDTNSVKRLSITIPGFP
jgi:Rab guanine nucleotide exchange factor SEC2